MASTPRIAITGANGWIGSRLCAEATRRGWAVRPIPRDTLGSPDGLAAALAGCDVVVHLAAAVHRRPDAVPEEEYDQVNVRLTERLAAAARAAAVGRFVFVSSAKVLGERTRAPARETDPASPEDAYARSKLAAEHLLARVLDDGGPALVVLRPPLVYGPGVRANFLALLRLADSGWPLPLAAAGAPRSMVFVDNLVDAILFVCDSPRAAGGTYYVNDELDLTVVELVKALRSRLGRPARVFRLPDFLAVLAVTLARWLNAGRPPGFTRLFQPLQVDDGALRGIGWRAPVDKDTALERTVRWYRER